MLPRFFIHRPVFALVLSIVVALLGAVAIPVLPVEETPDITPPTVSVRAAWPGASAPVIAENVAVPIEQRVNGVDDMLYLSSTSADDGSMAVTVTFDVGVDVDMATVLVQNRVAAADPLLPEEAKRQGITTTKQSTNMVQVVNLVSPGGRYDDIYISNYINLNVTDVLSRVPGVANVQVFGARDYGMRVWLDPARLKARGLTTTDVVAAIRSQNVQVAAGQIGAPPTPSGQSFQYTVNAAGRLSEVAEFENLILRVDDGAVLRLRDVARVELGAQNYATSMRLNGQPSVALAIYQLPGANALAVADGVEAAMATLAERFPDGLEYRIAYDATGAITASIEEVVVTLLIAVLLVVGTVYLFLQDIRTTLIPAVTIPVSLLGTFGVMLVLGLSINTLTLFGLVLAIGIVVDDAIVVVENTMRLIDTEGLSAKEAAARAMEQVTGPVVATTLVLLAVFVPIAMMGGITGRLFSQFALTISTATVLSSFNALTLSPALCALLLRPTPTGRGALFRWFNRGLGRATTLYAGVVAGLARRVALVMAVFAGLLAAGWLGFASIPGGFVPDEDKGTVFVHVQLPDSASLERTEAVLGGVTGMLTTAVPGVQDVITIGGFSLLTGLNASNMGAAIAVLDDWGQRSGPGLHAAAIAEQISGMLFMQVQEAVAFGFTPPPIAGLGNAAGFEFVLQDRGGLGPQQLQTFADDLAAAANAHPALTRVNSSFRANVPQLDLDVDRTKTQTLGVALDDVFGTLQAYLGSAYVNDFSRFGRTYRVMIQADAAFRRRIDDIRALEVRDAEGNMIPLGTLLAVRDTVGPQAVTRYNLFPSATITGSPAPGFSAGEARQAMETLAARLLPPSMGFEWTGTTFQQIAAGNQAPLLFALAFVLVFLFLAAQYESWLIPVAVVLAIPFSLIGAFCGTLLRAYDNNVYTQIGLVLLIGLSAKTAILVVEFAKQLREQEGRTTLDAAVEAARLRFRAVLMTAVSFILGVLPLLIATGAGAASRRALGTAVFSGMAAATLPGVIFIPVFYVLVQRIRDRRAGPPAAPPVPPAGGGPGPGGASGQGGALAPGARVASRSAAGAALGQGGATGQSSATRFAAGAVPGPGGASASRGVASRSVGAVLLAAACASGACATAGPDYVRPESPMPGGAPAPDAWHAEAVAGLDTGEARLQRWWEMFDDPTLVRLIDRARTANLDVRRAVARVRESRAAVAVVAGGRLPVIDAVPGVSVSRASPATLPPGFDSAVTASATVGAALSWEPDVFGRVSRGVEAAIADYDAAVEDVRDVLVSLSAEVALSYVDARTTQERLAVAHDNLRSQEESLRLTRDRFEAGLTSALDVAQAETNLYDTRSRIPPLERALASAFNRLAILLAEAPGALAGELRDGGPIPAPRATGAVGIPADIVRQRPDVRRAERRLAAQTARIGVAAADLYPRFSLGGAFSFDVGNVGDRAGFGWNVLPGLRWNLFDRDRIHRRIDVEEERAAQALADYERTMLAALEDVENAMVAYGREQERRVRLQEAVAAAQRAVDLVRTQYVAGLTDFQNVLDSQRSLFNLGDQLADANGAVVGHLVTLYRALGGGWDVTDPPGPPAGDPAAVPGPSPPS